MRATTSFVCVLVVLFASFALGDVVHLKSGAKIEGEVLKQDDKEVVVKTRFGTQTFPRDQVLKIEEKATKKDEYRKRLEDLQPKDAEGHYQLGLWCRAEKLNAEATQAFLKAVQIDPEHEGAHKALGHEKYEGIWVTPGQKKLMEQKKEEEEYAAKGMVRYKGEWIKKEDLEKVQAGYVQWTDPGSGKVEWVTPADRAKLEKGLVQYEGRWLPREEAEALEKGLFKVEGNYVDKQAANEYHSNWDNAWELESEHYRMRTNRDYDSAMEALAKAEKAYQAMKEFFGEEPDLKNGKLAIFMFGNQDEYNQFGQQNAAGDEGWRQGRFGGFHAYEHPETPAAVYSFYDEANRYDWTEYHLYHALAVQYLAEVQPNIKTAWLRESIVAYFQYFAHYKWPSLRESWGRYIIGNRFIPFDDFTSLNNLAGDPQSGFYVGGDKPTQQAQGGLLILYLTKTGPTEYHEQFQEFLDKVKKSSLDAETFERVFNMRKLEKDFQEWVNALE
jgi:hypothetical protein